MSARRSGLASRGGERREILRLRRGGLVAPFPRHELVCPIELFPPVPAFFPLPDDLRPSRV